MGYQAASSGNLSSGALAAKWASPGRGTWPGTNGEPHKATLTASLAVRPQALACQGAQALLCQPGLEGLWPENQSSVLRLLRTLPPEALEAAV